MKITYLPVLAGNGGHMIVPADNCWSYRQSMFLDWFFYMILAKPLVEGKCMICKYNSSVFICKKKRKRKKHCVWGGKKRNRCDSEWQQFATSWLVFSNTFLHWNFVESCPNQVLSMYIRVHNFHNLFFVFFLTVLGKYNNLRYWRYWINNNQSLNKIDLKHFTLHAMNMEYMIM